MDMSDLEKAQLLDMPISPNSLFGNAVGSFSEKFLEAQKQSKVLNHVHPKGAAAPLKRSRYHSGSILVSGQITHCILGLRKDPEPAVSPPLSPTSFLI